MHSADYAVCPSVRLSHASNLSKRLHISSNFVHLRVATPFYQTGWQYFDGNLPPNGRVVARGYEKIAIFV